MPNTNRSSIVHRRDAGVTLIELMTVIVVIGIMLGLAAPSMTGIIGVNRAESAARQVAGDLMYARVLAVRSGSPVTVTFTGMTYQITSSGSGVQAKTVDLSRDYPMTTFSPAATTVNFNSRGLVTAGTGEFLAISEGHQALFMLTGVGGIQRDF